MRYDDISDDLDASTHSTNQVGHHGSNRHVGSEPSQCICNASGLDFLAPVPNGNQDALGFRTRRHSEGSGGSEDTVGVEKGLTCSSNDS